MNLKIIRYCIYLALSLYLAVYTFDFSSLENDLHITQTKRGLSSHKLYSKQLNSMILFSKSKNWGLSSIHLLRSKMNPLARNQVVVAIIDTGISTNHKSLSRSLWINSGEVGTDENGLDKSTNGIDDDENGFVDDIHGWNFVKGNNKIDDNHGHGTHIAGIIAGSSDRQGHPVGISPNTKIMVLKYYDPFDPGTGNLDNTVSAIDYAIDMGADIINYSSGGLQPSEKEKLAISRAMKKGILFVSAAGNEKSNLDNHGYYPADYGLNNIISVTAIDRKSNVLPSSNYSPNKVDLAAPGNRIWSTLPNNSYGEMTGTSQATGFVSGVAALLIQHGFNPRDYQSLKRHLIFTGQQSMSLKSKTTYKVKLNAERALIMKGANTHFASGYLENSRINSSLLIEDQTLLNQLLFLDSPSPL